MTDVTTVGSAENPRMDFSQKDKGILILLSTLVGGLGVDRFYRGQIGLGILKLLTGGGCGIWALVDSIIYMVGTLPTDYDGKSIIDGKTRDKVRSGVSDFAMKDKGVLLLLSTLLGVFGVDRFYRGQIGLGILKLLTFGGIGVWALIDSIVYMVGELPTDSNGMPIADRKTLEILGKR